MADSPLGIRAEFDVPVGEVEEMLPAFVVLEAKIDLHELTPLGPLGFADQMHASLGGRAVGLARIAPDAGTDNVFPRGRTSPVSRDDMIQVEILPFENFAAILASVAVPLENVVPGELDFLLGQPIEEHQQNDPRNADFE